MYLRVTTVRRESRVYRYAQIVESYRRKDGKPTNRVLLSLGALDDAAIAAWRTALEIARKGGAPVLPVSDKPLQRARVLRSFRYLDLAVLLRTWKESGLHRLVADAIRPEGGEVATEEVVAALVMQRCVAPGSKLAASRWYPKTALPELQGVAPGQFNNSRVHRALAALDVAEASLQEFLPGRLAATEGPASALVIDATDTWFAGHGPPLAAKGRDKEGLYRTRVGIVLLCDHRGLPLRWHTLDGRFHDPTALADMAEEVSRLTWAADLPLVVDRALGNAGWVDKLNTLGLRWVTCVPAPELESCGAPIPWEILDACQKCEDEPSALRDLLRDAGFVRVHDERYVRDLGTFSKSRPVDAERPSQAVITIQTLTQIEALGKATIAQTAELLGISTALVKRHRRLRTLLPEVRRRLLSGEADTLGMGQLEQLARVPAERQVEAFDELLITVPLRRRQAQRKRVAETLTIKAKGALVFSPSRFLQDRRKERENLARIRAAADDINRRLRHPQCRRSDLSAVREIDRLIHKHGLGTVCTPQLHKVDGVRSVLLDFNTAAWNRRRRSDGLNLVVTHPDVPGSAAEQVARYFAKDVIEKDFQAIKSVLALRPIRHRTDHKLRAHVTICVLALLLERLLESRLAAAGKKLTTVAAVELFEPCRLGLVDQGGTRFYTVTDPEDEARGLLEALGMRALVDDVTIGEEITAR